MKRILLALGMAWMSATAWAGPSVGVSVSVNQPGVYGRVDIGNVPQAPVVIYPQPVVITQPAVVVDRRPIYLRVPPRHSHDWRRYCGRYNACGQPVYFVREDWYQRHYHPSHRARGDRWDRDDHRRHDR
ncbi:MAG: hypothetical protein ACM32J_13050, partial [Rhizobacter sp.]